MEDPRKDPPPIPKDKHELQSNRICQFDGISQRQNKEREMTARYIER
jgi:hypothetical protein